MSLSRHDDSDRLVRELDWNLLRTFIAIVQEGGITAAADRLLLKQPSVSNALKRLETSLGKRLIERCRQCYRCRRLISKPLNLPSMPHEAYLISHITNKPGQRGILANIRK